MGRSAWQKCLDQLQNELSSKQFNTWIRPLHASLEDDRLRLMAPNRYVKNQVRMAYLERICELLDQSGNPAAQLEVTLDVGTVEDSRRSHVKSGLAPLKTSIIGSIKLRCWKL